MCAGRSTPTSRASPSGRLRPDREILTPRQEKTAGDQSVARGQFHLLIVVIIPVCSCSPLVIQCVCRPPRLRVRPARPKSQDSENDCTQEYENCPNHDDVDFPCQMHFGPPLLPDADIVPEFGRTDQPKSMLHRKIREMRCGNAFNLCVIYYPSRETKMPVRSGGSPHLGENVCEVTVSPPGSGASDSPIREWPTVRLRCLIAR